MSQDPWPPRDDRSGEKEREAPFVPMWLWVLLVALVIAAAVAGLYFWQQRGGPAPLPDAPTLQDAAPPAAVGKPEIRHPVPTAEAEPEKALPTLDESDGLMREFATELVDERVFDSLVIPEQLIRRIVATVDNLPRKAAPVQKRPLRPVPGQFTPDAVNPSRYAAYVRVLESLDARAVVRRYVRLYPLFQSAYVELGYPDRYFNDRLVEAIDDMLAAPEPPAPLDLVQPKVFYQYADPALESRSAGQKIMMRMGAANAAKVRAKLREIRKALVAPS